MSLVQPSNKDDGIAVRSDGRGNGLQIGAVGECGTTNGEPIRHRDGGQACAGSEPLRSDAGDGISSATIRHFGRQDQHALRGNGLNPRNLQPIPG